MHSVEAPEQQDSQALPSRGLVSLASFSALFQEGRVSLARAAKLAELSLVDFMQHLSRQGIPVVQGVADEAEQDMETLETWLKPF